MDDLPWVSININGKGWVCPIPEAEARELWESKKQYEKYKCSYLSESIYEIDQLRFENKTLRDKWSPEMADQLIANQILREENTRLRKALEVYGNPKYYKFKRYLGKDNKIIEEEQKEPWLIAQEALKDE